MSFKKLQFQKITFEEMDYNANQFFQKVSSRRSVRDFSKDDFPIEIIKNWFNNYNLDFIYGRQHQNTTQWKDELSKINFIRMKTPKKATRVIQLKLNIIKALFP